MILKPGDNCPLSNDDKTKCLCYNIHNISCNTCSALFNIIITQYKVCIHCPSWAMIKYKHYFEFLLSIKVANKL